MRDPTNPFQDRSEIMRRKDGKKPCGECRIKAGETCDICGAKGPAIDTRAIRHPPYAHPGDVA